MVERPAVLRNEFWTRSNSPILQNASLAEMSEFRAMLLPEDWYQDMDDFGWGLNEPPIDCNPWAPSLPKVDPADLISLDDATMCLFVTRKTKCGSPVIEMVN